MKFRLFALFLLLAIAGTIVVIFYPYIFSKRVRGEIVNVQRVAPAEAIIGTGGKGVNNDFFSFAIAVRDEKSQEIFTASSDDRQWAVAETGKCVETKIFPYPPWNLGAGGTYHNARLIKLYDCPTR